MRGGSSRGEWGPASGNYPAGIQVRKQSSHCDPQHQTSHRRVKTVIRAPSSYHTGALLANGDDQNTTARLKGARRALPTSTRPLKSIQYHSSPQVSTACLVSKAKKVVKAGLDKTPLLISASVTGNRRAVTKQESPTLPCSHPPPVKRVKGTSS